MNRKERRRQARNGETPLPQALGQLIAHYQAGRLSDALATAEEILESTPDEPDVLHIAAAINGRLGNHRTAVALADRLLARAPAHRDGLLTRAEGLLALGQGAPAADTYRKALAAMPADDPGRSGVCYNLGIAAREAADFDGAAQAFQEALAIRPDYPEALLNLGNLVHAAGMADLAADLFRQATDARPNYAEAWNNLGNALRDVGQGDAALAALERAVALRADYSEARNNLGIVRLAQGDAEGAVSAFRTAVDQAPGDAGLLANLGQALRDAGRPEEALEILGKALAARPDHPAATALRFPILQDLCAWEDWDAAAAAVAAATEAALAQGAKPAETPFNHVARCDDPAANRAVAAAWSAEIARRADAVGDIYGDMSAPTSDGRITIGYLSSDFHDHATAHLMRTLFARHDRGRFAVNAYSSGPDDGSGYRARIAADCDAFVDVRTMTDAEAARRIRADGVDVLVELKGHTRGNRLGIAALRPAPVQVSYLGFPGTIGADFLDYILTDRVVTPEDEAAQYSEAPVWLPGCYQVNDDTQEVAGPVRRADEGLPEDAVVFCSFNRAFKLDPVTFDAWMALLRDVPGSVLWLFSGTEAVHSNLRSRAAAAGVDGARLVFAGHRDKAGHLARLGLADIALDTRIYGGHTTTSDALWAGVPVITVRGRHFASRVSASILEAAGLADLVTADREAYAALARDLAADSGRRTALRERVAAARSSALFDTRAFAADLDRAYAEMWRRHQAGEAPAPFAVADLD